MQPTILVIDDIALNCEVITLALQSRGYQVVSALDGIEGIKAAQQYLPDTILLDVMMPHLNGFDTCRRLKSLPETSAIPVIMMTALNDTGSKVKAFEAGAADYISKPIDADEMVIRIQSQVRLYHLAHDLEQKNSQLQQAVTALEAAQEQLIRQNQERLHMILNATGTGIWEWEFVSSRIHWSESVLTLLGAVHQDNLTYQDYLARVHPDDRDSLHRSIEQIIQSPDQPYHNEHRILLPNGQVHWIEAKGRIFFDDQQQPLSLMGTVVDITERKRVQEALRKSEERFAKAFHVNPSGVAISRTSERVVLDANDQMLHILGYQRDEFLTPGAVDIWIDADQQHDFLYRAQRDGNVLSEEVQFRRKDDRIIDGLISVAFFEQKGEQYWITMIQDVTERKQVERSLREREETARQFQDRLRALIEASVLLSDARTLDDLYREIVVLGRSMLGFDRLALFLLEDSRQHILGTFGTDTEGKLRDERDLRSLLSEDNAVIKIIESGERVHCWHDTPLRDQWQDVAIGWNALAVVWDGNKAVGYMPADNLLRGEALLPYQLDLLMLYGTVVGYLITRKRSEIAIHRYAEQLRMLNAIDQAILRAASAEATARAVVGDLKALLGFHYVAVVIGKNEPGEMVRFIDSRRLNETRTYPADTAGEPLYTMLIGQDAHSHRRLPAYLRDLLEAHAVQSYIAIPLTADLEEVGLLLVGQNSAGDFAAEQVDTVHAVSLQLSIALRQAELYEHINRHARDLERLVSERTAQLEAKASELEAFTYSVSHDLRAPLRAMHGFSNTLLQHYSSQLPEKAQHYVTRINQNAYRMGVLIDDLLELSRVGRKELRKQTVAVASVVAEILHDLNADHQVGNAQITLGDLPPCQADPILLKQALVNLISNAIKYSRHTPQPMIEIGSAFNQQEIVYYIKDNGVGFDMVYADKLFGVFQRLHSEQEYEGTGIGLATVHQIIDRHGGRVWAEAIVNQGATFYFVLPSGDQRE